jgi:hypothetical protein
MARAARGDRGLWTLWLVAAGALAALTAALAPLLAISAYNHSYADDWHYGVWAHLALQASGGDFLSALGAAFQQVGTAYVDWQGTYSAIFLMALEPGIVGEGAYVVAAPIILAALVAATFWSSHVLLREWLHLDRPSWIAVASLVLVLQTQLLPSPVEGIFWYNSAVYYTFFHSLMLVLLAMVLRSIDPGRKRPARGAVIASTVVALLVAGGNFVTVLVTAELLAVLCIVLWVRRSPRFSLALPPAAALVCGGIISMAAPGNSVRQQTQFPEDALGAVDTIWHSSLAAFQYLSSWTTGLVVVAMGVVAVLVVRAAFDEDAPRRAYRFPGLASVGSIALFATSFTPTFYSMGTVGPGRVQNVRLELYVVLLVLNIAYWAGWAAWRARVGREPRTEPTPAEAPASGLSFSLAVGAVPEQIADEPPEAPASPVAPAPASAPAEAPRLLPARTLSAVCGVLLLVFALAYGAIAFDSKLGEDLTSVSAARSLVSGQAADYDQQVRNRLQTIESSTEDTLQVPFYTNAPKVLFMGDIRDNMSNYINYRLCQWYGKTSIIGYLA